MSTELAISQLRIDGGTQPRAALDFEAIDDYADAMADGEKFPPVVLYYDGENYWLADGFHRVKAAWQAGWETITAEVRSGTLEDARWHSFSANKANGLRRTNDDKQRAVKGALQHPRGAELSDREIARHVGVDHVTVSRWRDKLCLSGEIHQIDSRSVTRNGSIFQQDTAGINRRPRTPTRQSTPPTPPASIANTTQTSPRDRQVLAAVVSAIQTIAACQVKSMELASWLLRQADATELIPILENANVTLSEILFEVRRTADSA